MPKIGMSLALEHLADHRHRVLPGCRRVAGAVRKEEALGVVGEDVLGGRARGQHRDVAAGTGEAAQDVALGAVVDRDDPPSRTLAPPVALGPGPAHLVPAVALGAGDILGEVHALEPREGAGPAQEVVEVEVAVGRVADCDVRGALEADRPGEPPGVDAADADPPAPGQPAAEIVRRAPARRLRRVPLDHHARGDGVGGLVVLGVYPDVTDMWEREGDDLTGVGRIGHDLLVAGHRRVEAELAHGDPDRSEAPAVEDLAVGEDDAGRGLQRAVRRRGQRPVGGCKACGHDRIPKLRA